MFRMITALIICVNSCVFNRLHTPFPKYKHFLLMSDRRPYMFLPARIRKLSEFCFAHGILRNYISSVDKPL